MRVYTKLFCPRFPIFSLEINVALILPNPNAAPHSLFYRQKYYRYDYMWLKCLFAVVEPEWMVLYIIHAIVAPGRFSHEPHHLPFPLQVMQRHGTQPCLTHLTVTRGDEKQEMDVYCNLMLSNIQSIITWYTVHDSNHHLKLVKSPRTGQLLKL